MRVAIVNDMMMAVEALRRVLVSAPEHEIAWIARDGVEAVEKCAQDTPDLILMDLIMPNMDGAEATRRIMEQTPCAILVVTATVEGNAAKVFQAMGFGALDAVNTPVLGAGGQPEGGADLLKKVGRLATLIGKPVRQAPPQPAAAPSRPDLPTTGRAVAVTTDESVPPLVVIGASTGGPKALADVLTRLPSAFDAAVVIIQHVNAEFAPGMAEWLNDMTPLAVQAASEGAHVETGMVFLPKTDDHLVMAPDRTLTYSPDPRDNPYRPSVDVFFSSVASHWPAASAAALLTGMGKDGARGLMDLRRAGWHTIAQD